MVSDFELGDDPAFADLLALVDHLVLSAAFAARWTGAARPAAAVDALWGPQRAAVVVTAGAEGCWYRTREDTCPRHAPGFRVRAVDTTGCGDVFRGAYAAGLARGLPVAECVRMACGAAALKATQGGQAGVPDAAGLERLLRAETGMADRAPPTRPHPGRQVPATARRIRPRG